jgi:two-component system, OmpR family, phosphate regulon sensor histidine kinase PhoR
MTFLVFILGLALGVGFHFWSLIRLRKRIEKVLSFVSDDSSQLNSLPLVSLVRREISNLDRQNQQLNKNLETWQELMEQAPIGYLQVDEENQLLWCNQQARKLLKIDRWQPGQIRLLLELVRSIELDRSIELTRSSQQPQQKEWIFNFTNYSSGKKNCTPEERANEIVFDREAIALKSHTFPLPKQQVAIFLIDRQPLIDLSQQRERAFSDLAHELRTPLTSILLVTETLQKRLQNPERQWVESMLKEIDRLIKLVADWLEISKLQENPVRSLQYHSVELKDLIISVWKTLEKVAAQKSISMSFSGLEIVKIQADPSRLHQVFLNIFDNAIKNSPERGTIFIEISTTEIKQEQIDRQAIAIDIFDAGAGFLKADLLHVFDRLYRGDRSRTRQSKSSGSGLGLAIVKEIISAHSGTIQANNHPQTGGAWLRILLPVEQVFTAEGAEEAEEAEGEREK